MTFVGNPAGGPAPVLPPQEYGGLVSRTKILVTGGAGFIGRALVGLCLEKGHQVAVYDSLKVGRLSNLAPYRDRITFFENDIQDEGALDAAFQSFAPERVVHLAALHFIPYCNAHPQETMDVNVSGTYAVLAACARYEVQTSVVASSGALYGSETHSLNEDLDLPAPVDVYGLSKLLGEQICKYFTANARLNCVAARLFNTYGPYETNAHILPDIVQQLKRSDTLELGNLDPKRDYIYVDDTAAALLALSELAHVGFDVFNVGTGHEYSVRELVDMLGEITQRRLIVRQDSTRIRKVDKMHQIASVSKLSRTANFSASIGLGEGLRRLLIAENLVVG